MSGNKRKAFTLTELLVVVVVIGVLAAVVLPKYTKVIETRKTTEAENMMAAVRTEQEYRCALDKPYIGEVDKLVTAHILPSENTKNFNYSLQSQGMMAESSGKYNYTLQMPSYADGRLCCDGEDCNKLNKNYPTCEELIAKPDYQVATECKVDPSDPPGPKDCVGSKPSEQEVCSSCGGTHSRTVTCNYETGLWETGGWNLCSITDEECNSCEYKVGNDQDKNTEYLRCIDPDYYRYKGSWNESTCSCDCPPETVKDSEGYCVKKCQPGGKERCEGGHGISGEWDGENCECICPPGSTLENDGECHQVCNNPSGKERCEGLSRDGIRGTWNNNTCSCDCPSGTGEDNDGACSINCFHLNSTECIRFCNSGETFEKESFEVVDGEPGERCFCKGNWLQASCVIYAKKNSRYWICENDSFDGEEIGDWEFVDTILEKAYTGGTYYEADCGSEGRPPDSYW